ncbi:MAG: hypothetical protein AAGD00_09930 [Planctomycetota bacterium]
MSKRGFVSGMGVGAGAVIGGLILGGAARPGDDATSFDELVVDTLRVRDVRVVNDRGHTLTLLTSTKLGGAVTLFDVDGNPVLAAGVDEAGGIMQALAPNGAVRVEASASGLVEVRDEQGELRVQVSSYSADGNTVQPWRGEVRTYERQFVGGRLPSVR